jgi:hypothetical protein
MTHDPPDQVIRWRRFLAAHNEWEITPLGRGSRFIATRDEPTNHTVVAMSLRELLDRLDRIVGGDEA